MNILTTVHSTHQFGVKHAELSEIIPRSQYMGRYHVLIATFNSTRTHRVLAPC